MRLYFIYAPGCGHCEAAKPHVRKFEKAHPEIQVVWFDLTSNPWTYKPWSPDVTPTYVAELPGKQKIQYQGQLTKDEMEKFVARAKQMMGAP